MFSPDCKISSDQRADTDQKHQIEEDKILCAVCKNVITHRVFQILVDDQWRHVFANPHGIVFEIVCFGQAGGVSLFSPPSNDFSWFPGYSWRVAGCSDCGTHLGWQFVSRDHYFYGLILEKLINI